MRRKYLNFALSFCFTLVYWRVARILPGRKQYNRIYVRYQSSESDFTSNLKSFSTDYYSTSPTKQAESFPAFSNASNSCFSVTAAQREISTAPRYRLDGRKLLIPNLYNGPSNQMTGFQQSALVAILLNRTLVLPPFYYHTIQSDHPKKVARADERLDVGKLSELLSIATLDEAVEICQGKLDAVFHAEAQKEISLVTALPRFHMETGLQGAKYRSGVTTETIAELYGSTRWNVESVKPLLDTTNNGSFLFGRLHSVALQDVTAVRNVYKSDARCAIYQHPFRQLHIKLNLRNGVTHKSTQVLKDPWTSVKTNEEAAALLADIKRHTQPPKSILKMAQEFTDEFLSSGRSGQGYIAAHWRFDEEDFLHYLCLDHAAEQRSSACDNIKRAMNHTALATAVAKLAAAKNAPSVYVAAPATLRAFMHSVKTTFGEFVAARKLSIKIFTSDELKQFVSRKYKFCRQQPDYVMADVIAEIERVLCSEGATFLWSVQSTWSAEARFRRKFVSGKGDAADQNIVRLVLSEVDGSDVRKRSSKKKRQA